jgi:hypothetical protein
MILPTNRSFKQAMDSRAEEKFVVGQRENM